MAAEWTPFAGWGGGKAKKASSEKTGPFAVSGRGAGSAGSAGPAGGAQRPAGVRTTDPYIAELVRDAPAEQHRSVLQREEVRLTGVSGEHDRTITQRRREGFADTDPRIQGWLKLTRGTDAEYRRNGGKPLPGTLNDRVQRIRAVLGEPATASPPDVLEPVNRFFGRNVLGGPPQPLPASPRPKPQMEAMGAASKRLLGRDVWSTPAPKEARVREDQIEGPQVAQLDPSISLLKKFGPVLGLGGWNAAPEEMLETWELWKQQARAGKVALPPKLTGPDDERMFAQVRNLSTKFYRDVVQPRSRQRYPETTYQVPGLGQVKGPPLPTSPEPLEAYRDAGLTELYERFPEWLQAQSKTPLPHQMILFAMAMKDLAKLQRQRAGRLAVSTLTDIGMQAGSAATAAGSGPGAGQAAAKTATQLPKATRTALQTPLGQAIKRTIGPQEVARRYLGGAGTQATTDFLTHPELSPEDRWKRAQHAGASTAVTGTALHGAAELGGVAWSAARGAKSSRTNSAKISIRENRDTQFGERTETRTLQVGDWVTIPDRPELGIAQVRQIQRNQVVVWPRGERKAGGAVKISGEAIRTITPSVSSSLEKGSQTPGVLANRTPMTTRRGSSADADYPASPERHSQAPGMGNGVRAGDIEPTHAGGAGATKPAGPDRPAGQQHGSPKRVVLDLFGGERSQIPGAINVDLIAQEGVRASAGEGVYLPFKDGVADEVVASGPRTTFLPEAIRVLRPGGRIYINASARNKFGKLSTHLRGVGTLEELGLRLIQDAGPLPERFKSLVFRLTDGREMPHEAVTTTILEKVR